MKTLYWKYLNAAAKRAIKRGTGKYEKFAVDIIGDKTYIAAVENGRPMEWVMIIKESTP